VNVLTKKSNICLIVLEIARPFLLIVDMKI